MSIEQRIVKVVEKNIESNFTKYNVTLESMLIDDLNVDSFSKMMIIAGLEDEFNIEINIDEFSDISTVHDIVNKLSKIVGEGSNE
ncbi:MAG TPA: acyl carrier protein [Clostridiales bacterium]|nr:MAG: hypothetical protein A2Y22_03670 [Clostridiales bacterium GWD2_32_59]HAN09674.1 acyl carrier protein [Clostridiales bacterium]